MADVGSECEELVLVTGASGYIAAHVVYELQHRGYKVRGTVRSLQNERKVKPLLNICPDAKYKLELVEADLNNAESWTAAVKDCLYVIHVASPFPSENPRDEDEVIKPAVDGCLNVLKAVQAAGTAKRVVLTSSVAALSNGFEGSKGRPADQPFTENDWTDIDQCDNAYLKSKTMAEKAAWDFVKNLPDEQKFELAVINPAYVMGPVKSGGDATSLIVPKRLLERGMPALPKIYFAIADVRDVATAHVAAMKSPGAAGNRHIICTSGMWFKAIADIVKSEFKPQGYNVPSMEAPNFFIRLYAIFDKTVRMIVPSLGLITEYDNSRMKNVLGIEPHSLKDTIIDMCYSMIETGFVKKTQKYQSQTSANKE